MTEIIASVIDNRLTTNNVHTHFSGFSYVTVSKNCKSLMCANDGLLMENKLIHN